MGDNNFLGVVTVHFSFSHSKVLNLNYKYDSMMKSIIFLNSCGNASYDHF